MNWTVAHATPITDPVCNCRYIQLDLSTFPHDVRILYYMVVQRRAAIQEIGLRLCTNHMEQKQHLACCLVTAFKTSTLLLSSNGFLVITS